MMTLKIGFTDNDDIGISLSLSLYISFFPMTCYTKAGLVERLSVGAVLGAGGGEEPVARFSSICSISISIMIIWSNIIFFIIIYSRSYILKALQRSL